MTTIEAWKNGTFSTAELPGATDVSEAVFVAILMASDTANISGVNVVEYDDSIGTPPGAKCTEMGVPGITVWSSSDRGMSDKDCVAVLEKAVVKKNDDNGVVELLIPLPTMRKKYRVRICRYSLNNGVADIHEMQYLSDGKWMPVDASLFRQDEILTLSTFLVLSSWDREDGENKKREMPLTAVKRKPQFDPAYLNRYGEVRGVPYVIVGYDTISEKYLATNARKMGEDIVPLYRISGEAVAKNFIPVSDFVQRKTGREIYVKTDEFDTKKDFPTLFRIKPNEEGVKIVVGYDLLSGQYIQMDMLTGAESHVPVWDAASYVEPTDVFPRFMTGEPDKNHIGRAFISAPAGRNASFRVIVGQDAVTGNYLYASFSVDGDDSYKTYPGGGDAFAKRHIYDECAYFVSKGWHNGMVEINAAMPYEDGGYLSDDAIKNIIGALYESRYGDASAECGTVMTVYTAVSENGRRKMAKYMGKFVKSVHNPLKAVMPTSLYNKFFDAAEGLLCERLNGIIESEIEYDRMRLAQTDDSVDYSELRFLRGVKNRRQLRNMLAAENETADIVSKIFLILEEVYSFR